MAERTPDSVLPMTVRTRYFDDFLLRTVQESGLRQVALLAAGLDTRALTACPGRRARAASSWTRPRCWRTRRAILSQAGAQPACQRFAVPADLTTPWGEKLVQAGFDPAQPSMWLLEGFLFYISSEDIRRVLGAVSALAAPGSWLGGDVVNSVVLTSPYTVKWVEMQAALGAPWIGTLDDPTGTLAALGWEASLSQPGEPGANFGRWKLPVLPTQAPGLPHNWYVTAIRK